MTISLLRLRRFVQKWARKFGNSRTALYIKIKTRE